MRQQPTASGALEILNGSLVFFGRLTRWEGAQVPSLPCFFIGVAAVDAVLTGLELADHTLWDACSQHDG